MVIFRGRQGIPNYHDIYIYIWYGEKKQESIKTNMFQFKNSLNKQHFKDPNISPLHISIHPSGCWLMFGSYPDPQVTVSPAASHLWGDTICPASAPKHFGCRWRSPKHNGPRCFCREGFLVAKKSCQMTAWYQNTPGRTQQDFDW